MTPISRTSISLILCLTVLMGIPVFAGCANYRVVELERFHDPVNKDAIVTTYAATKNNMIIPELTIDRTGRYPTDKKVATERLQARREAMQKLITEKYKTENSTLYQTKRISFMIGQIIVSPIVVPIMFVSDLFNRTVPEHEGSSSLLKHYLKSIVNPPIPQKPVFRDELAVV
jgi:hypothetical protein